jgi:hypothetical protein
LDLAKQRFNHGVLDRDLASTKQALDALRLAMAISGASGLFYNAARVEQQLGHCREATDLYRRFLAKRPESTAQARAEHQLARLGACDDSQPGESAWVVPQVSHTLQWNAVGPSGDDPPVGWGQLEVSADTPPGVPVESIVVWGLAGGAGLSAVLASVFFVRAWGVHEDFEDTRNNPQGAGDGSHLIELQEQGRSAQRGARVFGVIAGTLGLATGVGFWLTSRAADDSGVEQVPAGVGMRAVSDGVAASWTGHF